MHEKIYKAFHQDISIDDYKELDELKKKFEGMKPFNEYEKDGLKSYDDAFLVRFTYESNAIEGSTLSLGDTELVLEGEFTPNNNQRLREIFSARGCADGCAYIEKELENDRIFTEDFIKDIHERTTLDCQPRIRGSYRIAPVYIQGSLTEPVSPIQIRELMPTLLYAYENSDVHPIAKAAVFHAIFENIHPFQDGNGRVGRLIMFKECLKYNIVPFIIEEDLKLYYYRGLKEWDNLQGYLTDTCLTAQDRYKANLDYFRIEY
jgi:Fic family protein